MADADERRMYVLDDERQRLHLVAKDLWRCRDRIEDDETDHLPVRDDEREAIAPLLDVGYELVGWGIGRLVLRMPTRGDLDRFVVKLGRFGDDPLSIGMFQNREEVLLWHQVRDADWSLLPPMDWQGGTVRWLVMPYGTPLDADAIDPARRTELLAEGVGTLSQLESLDDIEFVPQNFVVWNDAVWLADYGRHGAATI